MPAVQALRRWYARKPRLTSWALLAAGMLALLTLFSLDAGLALREFLSMACATLLLAWLCVWIVFADAPDDSSRV